MDQREAQMGGRCTAPTHTATCVSPWDLRALTQNTPSANISVCTWASVKIAVPLAIFCIALQHDSSGQAIVPTIIFQLHVENDSLLLHWAKEIHGWYEKFHE